MEYSIGTDASVKPGSYIFDPGVHPLIRVCIAQGIIPGVGSCRVELKYILDNKIKRF
jgi:hypothetical protein